jgi:hypothetical protein
VYVRFCGTKSAHASFVTGLLQNIRYGMFEPSEVTGIPWYDRDTYGRILEIMEDAYLLPDTYEKWLRGATEIVARVYQRGDLPLRVRIEPVQFQAWCCAQGCVADVEARMEFVQAAAQEQCVQSDGRHRLGGRPTDNGTRRPMQR